MERAIRIVSLIVLVFLILACSGCHHSSEKIECYGKSGVNDDNKVIVCKDGFFVRDYSMTDIDENHIDLVFHLEKEE